MNIPLVILLAAVGLGWSWLMWRSGYEDGRMDAAIEATSRAVDECRALVDPSSAKENDESNF